MVQINDDLDSVCGVCRKDGDKTTASIRVSNPDGTFRYYCEDHFEDALRFGAAREDLDDDPLAVECNGCGRVTLYEDVDIAKTCDDCKAGDLDIEVTEEDLVNAAEDMQDL